VSFQVTFLKFLAGSSGRSIPLADLRRDVAILISGKDWTDRTKRLAARVPDLDILGQGLVVRDASGWQITTAGLAFLAAVDQPAAFVVPPIEPEPVAFSPPVDIPPIGISRNRRVRRRRSARRPRVGEQRWRRPGPTTRLDAKQLSQLLIPQGALKLARNNTGILPPHHRTRNDKQCWSLIDQAKLLIGSLAIL
jgi:hypothetical protein